jgi:2-polyprenyl-6-methoxyphenol hydroxylase-like FAD-dependent oxidoreductase
VLNIEATEFKRTFGIDSHGRDRADALQPPSATTESWMHVSRTDLERALRTSNGMELDERSEHRLTSAAPSRDSSQATPALHLEFANSHKLRPSFVVDALGTHSALREALLPGIYTLVVEPYAVYNHKKHVEIADYQSKFMPLLDGGTTWTHRPEKSSEPRLHVKLEDRLPSSDSGKPVRMSYTYSRPAQVSKNDDPLYKPNRSKSEADSISPEYYKEISDLASVEAIKSNPALRELLGQDESTKEEPKGAIKNWLMRTLIVSKQDLLKLLRQYGVAMIGDSVHATPILGGSGANMAITDAIELADVIAKHWDSGDLAAGVSEFYDTKWEEWNNAVQESKKELAALHRPVQTTGAKI